MILGGGYLLLGREGVILYKLLLAVTEAVVCAQGVSDRLVGIQGDVTDFVNEGDDVSRLLVGSHRAAQQSG